LVPFVNIGSNFVSLVMVELQMGQAGSSTKEKLSLIQQEHPSLLHVQIDVSSSGIGSTCFLEK
jgi:hypothetical protein